MAETNLNQRITNCIEMANEIEQESERQYCLASALSDLVETGTTAHGIAEVLAERLAESGQMIRLIATLEAIQDDYQAPAVESAGAIAVTEALRKIPQAVAGDRTQSNGEYFAKRESAITTLLAAAGPMPTRAAGAFRALAEFVVGGEQDGATYDLTKWTPVVARTPVELQAAIEEIDAA